MIEWNGGPSYAPSAGGILFTNDRGQVIFANQAFLDLMDVERRHMIMGKPLHRVLGVDQSTADLLLATECAERGSIRSVMVQIRDSYGGRRCLKLESIPAYDFGERFLGTNIIVKEMGSSESEASREVAWRFSSHKGERLRALFCAHLEALQLLMARIEGLRVREALESILNETAQANLWPVAMVDGNVYVDSVAQDPEVYRVLLGEAVRYAALVLDWPTVTSQMQKVEEQFPGALIDLAEETGLRAVYLADSSR